MRSQVASSVSCNGAPPAKPPATWISESMRPKLGNDGIEQGARPPPGRTDPRAPRRNADGEVGVDDGSRGAYYGGARIQTGARDRTPQTALGAPVIRIDLLASSACGTIIGRTRVRNWDESVDNPIQVEGLKKSYGDFAAVKGIDFEVHAGEVFRPARDRTARARPRRSRFWKGCGTRSGGRVRVLGFDPGSADHAVERPRRRVPASHESAGEDEGPRGHGGVLQPLHPHGGHRATAETPAALGEARGVLLHALRRTEAAAGAGPGAAQRSAGCCFWTSPRRGSIRRRASRFTNWCRTCGASSAPFC